MTTSVKVDHGAISERSRRTAIIRGRPSMPARWLVSKGYVVGRVLDYGCGRGDDCLHLKWEGYDPYYRPGPPSGKFDTILCTYVLNTLPEEEWGAVLGSIQELLTENGIAYISVRNDVQNLNGATSVGTYQTPVELDLSVVLCNTRVKIYVYGK